MGGGAYQEVGYENYKFEMLIIWPSVNVKLAFEFFVCEGLGRGLCRHT